MARIVFSSFVNSIRGSVGGGTIQRNAYGFTAKNKSNPCKSFSIAQTDQRAIMKELVNAWRGLSEDVQGVWNRFSTFSPTFSKHNRSSLLSGYNLFLKYNALRMGAGLDMLTDITFAPIVVPNYSLTLSYVTGRFSIVPQAYVDPASLWFAFKASLYRPYSYYIPPNSIRQLHPEVVAGYSWDIQNEYFSIYGSIPFDPCNALCSTVWFSTVAPIMSRPVLALKQLILT